MTLGELVQTACVGVEQCRHLVDESARAAGARAVHPLLNGLAEIDDLGILSAKLDSHVGLRDEGLDCRLAGDNLLHELDIEPFGEQQSARPGDGDGHGRIPVACRRRCLEHLRNSRAHVGVVTFVNRPDHVIVSVEQGELNGRRTDVDTRPQVRNLARPLSFGNDFDIFPAPVFHVSCTSYRICEFSLSLC